MLPGWAMRSGVLCRSRWMCPAVSRAPILARKILPAWRRLSRPCSTPTLAAPGCIDGRRKIQEASALRYQARQEARLGNHDRVCDTLDEIGDRYAQALVKVAGPYLHDARASDGPVRLRYPAAPRGLGDAPAAPR